MTLLNFNRYTPTGSDHTVVVERITHWHHIDYNGVGGTLIHLENGAQIRVGESAHEVERMVNRAMASKGSA